jgi:putative membrane-bound dehydrogenase-like protein
VFRTTGLILFLAATCAPAAEPTAYRAGVARIDITPDYPIRLAGFGFRRAESEGITHRTSGEALAIDAGGEPLLLVTADLCGVPAAFTEQLATRLRSAGVRRERFTLAVTHSHTAPLVTGYLHTLFVQPIPPEHQQHIDRYTAELLDKLENVAKEALANRRPARLSWGVGNVGFAVNRRTKGGPTDHDLPVLTVRDPDGKLRAVWASYACHCVTLSNNKISGDWAGFAKDAIQADNPGAVALISIGCGADQNPNSGVTGDKVEIATAQGRELAAEVTRLLGGFLAPVGGPIAARSHRVELPLIDLPPRSVWEVKAKNADPKQAAIAFHAKTQLARLDRGEPLATKIDYTVRAWTFGDNLALVFLPGEVVVDYGLRLKKELDGRRVWLNAYSNDVPCYIPSERVLKEGGYEGGWAMTYYDLPGPFKPGLEQPIIDAVKTVVGQEFRAQFDPAKTNGRPLSPQQSLAAIRMRPGMSAELMAAEPLVASPVAIAFGPDGRLWVAEMYDYPSGTDGRFQPGGRIRVLRASHGDGKYDQSTVFLDNIPFPTGVTVWRNGILVCAAPDILYAEDTKGTGKADVVKKLYSGFGTDNYQARVNSLEYGLDGWVYGSCGLFGSTITSFNGKTLALGNRDFRIKPDTGEIEPATGRTQQGRVRDDWDNWFGCDNTHLAWHYPLPDHYVRRNPYAAPPDPAVNLPVGDDPTRLFPAGDLQLFKLSGPPGRPTAVCGIGVYRDDLLGKDVTGDLFVCEPVNLLVHRMKLVPKGSTFAGKRAPGEEASEFLASTDPWFRPVQVRTGPDGCLWVVDMHRYVIEHPRWIPPEDLGKLDVRAGATLGRIFRVRPTDREPRPMLRLDKLDNAGLVAALDSPNGCQRDLAMQMLLWRDAKDAAPALAKMAVECPRPEGRLHALCALDGLGELTFHIVWGGGLNDPHPPGVLYDPHPGVLRSAARLAGRFPPGGGGAIGFLALALNANAQVRLQEALTLGEWDTGEHWLGGELVSLAHGHPDDPYLLAAVLSSVRSKYAAYILGIALGDHPERVPRLLPPLFRAAATSGKRYDYQLSQMLEKLGSLPPTESSMTMMAAALEALDGHPSLSRLPPDHPMMKHARATVTEPGAGTAERLAAISLLSRNPDERDIIARLLTAQQPAAIQSAAAAALARMPDPASVTALLAGWDGYTPALKSQILDHLLSRPGGTMVLLGALERKAVPAAQLDAARRQRLLAHKDAAIRKRAAMLFAATINPDRQKVIDAYQDVLKLNGDAAHGRAVFAKSCSACHQLDKVGHAVGPDLAQLQNKSPAYLLQEVLDPNRNVDSRYVEYRATTKAGRIFNGVLAAESATSVTLRAQEGRDQVLLRGEIEELESTGRSLMPEGLEKDLSRQDLADLFVYLGHR